MPQNNLNNLNNVEVQRDHALFVSTHGEEGKSWVFDGVEDSDKKITGLDLRKSHWSGELTNQNFKGVTFEGATFENVTFKDCNFESCSFKDASIVGGSWENLDFESCNLSGAFIGGDLNGKGNSMKNCYLKDMNQMGNLTIWLSNCQF